MIRAGRLNQRVTLLSPLRTKDPVTREPVLSWHVEAEVWATFAPLSPKRAEVAKQLYEGCTAEVWIRYNPALTPTTDWIVYHRGYKYEIGAVINEQMSNESYRLLCGAGERFVLPEPEPEPEPAA